MQTAGPQIRTCPAAEENKKEKAKQADALFSSVPIRYCRGQVGSGQDHRAAQREVRWGEGGGAWKGGDQSNKLNAHHYVLKTAFSSAQINNPRLDQVNHLMHN